MKTYASNLLFSNQHSILPPNLFRILYFGFKLSMAHQKKREKCFVYHFFLRFLVLLNFLGSQMITPRKFSCSQAKQQYGTGKRQLMMRWKLYCIRCFLIWCLGSKECSYSLENTPSNDIPFATKQILNICVQGGTS